MFKIRFENLLKKVPQKSTPKKNFKINKRKYEKKKEKKFFFLKKK